MSLVVMNFLHVANEQFTCRREFTDLLDLDHLFSQACEYGVLLFSSMQIVWRAPDPST